MPVAGRCPAHPIVSALATPGRQGLLLTQLPLPRTAWHWTLDTVGVLIVYLF